MVDEETRIEENSEESVESEERIDETNEEESEGMTEENNQDNEEERSIENESLAEKASSEIQEPEKVDTEIEEKVESAPEEKQEPEKPEPDKKPEKSGPEKKSRKKTLAIIGIILVVLIIAIVLYALLYNPEKTSKFNYHDFNFEIIPFGGISIYESNMSLISNGKSSFFNLRLRNDPRELDDIPMYYYNLPEEVYFSFTPETLNCSSDSLIAAFQLGQYLGKLGFSVTPSVTKNFSGNTLPLADCSNATNYTGVVILQPFSEEAGIYSGGDKCVLIKAENCSVIGVSERFIFSLVERYKEAGTIIPR